MLARRLHIGPALALHHIFGPIAAFVADLLCEQVGVELCAIEPTSSFTVDLRMDDLEPVELSWRRSRISVSRSQTRIARVSTPFLLWFLTFMSVCLLIPADPDQAQRTARSRVAFISFRVEGRSPAIAGLESLISRVCTSRMMKAVLLLFCSLSVAGLGR